MNIRKYNDEYIEKDDIKGEYMYRCKKNKDNNYKLCVYDI